MSPTIEFIIDAVLFILIGITLWWVFASVFNDDSFKQEIKRKFGRKQHNTLPAQSNKNQFK